MENNEFSNTNNNEYSKKYSESSFWDKVKKFAIKAGSNVIYAALKLYYTLQSTETPAWAKTVILGALGYFIAPVDAIPDVVPAVGFADDLGVLVAALATVSLYVDDNVKQKAKKQMKDWFGESEMTNLDA
jgi:uncharacterized membrane protein YkvA (DUF1232 family)